MSQARKRRDRDAVLRLRLDRLEAGLRDHVGWLQEVNRVFVCRQPSDEAQAAPEAHLHCDFGRWLHAELAKVDEDLSGFEEVARLHRDLHDSVRDWLGRYDRGEKLNVAAAESMGGCALRFWNGVRALQSGMAKELAGELPCAGGFAKGASPLPDNGNIAAQ